MEYRCFSGMRLSSLMLGTVQFGMSYGIANRSGQPSYEAVRGIIAYAWEGGVNCLDTASAYGMSEEVVGRALRELGLSDKIVVASKVYPMADEFSSARAADAFVEESVIRSLKRLRLDLLPICLFHREDNFRYVDSLAKLKDRGLVGCIGSSVMTPEAASSILSSGLAEALQVPLNVLDHRFTRTGICQKAAGKGTAVFARSVYLQGLILMSEGEIPTDLAEVRCVLGLLRGLAEDAGMSLGELALRYALSGEIATSVLIGVDSVTQMRDNLGFVSKGPLDEALISGVNSVVPDLPDYILMPNRWSRRAPDISPEKR